MAFDPLSWAIGYALKKGLDCFLIDKSLSAKLQKAFKQWSKNLPSDAHIYPDSDFAIIAPDADPAKQPSLCALRNTLLNNHIPTESQWFDALMEQWRSVPKDNIEEKQRFFGLPEETARQHLIRLAKDLADECAKHDPLFKIGTIDGIRNANTGINEIKTKLDDIIGRLDPGITNDTKLAIEKIFLTILQQKDIPQWQWSAKLQEITNRHQELLAKLQTIESDDPAVDKLRDNAHRMIELGDYDNADQLLQKAVAIDRKAIKSQQERLDNRKLSMSQSLASRANLAGTKLDYKEAIGLYEEALDILPQNQQTIQSVYLNSLALLYYTVANYKKAEPLMKLAVEILENLDGEPLPNYAKVLNNLAQLYQDTNRFSDAEQLMKRVLAIDEDSFGKDHPNLATDLNNLAGLYQDTNRFSEAEPLMKRAMAIDEDSFGKDHPKVALRLNNLALLYQSTNRLVEAEPLMKRALAIDESSFSKNHPNVSTDLNNLAQLYYATNRLSEAEPLMKRALAIDETSFGKDHPNVARDLNNLAGLYQATNRLPEAELLMKRAMAIDEASFGKDHSNVARDLNNLAGLYQVTYRFFEAEPMMIRVVEIFEKSLGKDHPNVATGLNNLAQLYKVTDRLSGALPLMKRAMAIDESSFGKDHPKVATDLNNLAGLYQATNRLSEAEPLMKQAVEILLQFTRQTGHPHQQLETAINNYTSLLMQMRYSKSEVTDRLKRLDSEMFKSRD